MSKRESVEQFLLLVDEKQYGLPQTQVAFIAFKELEFWKLYSARAFARNNSFENEKFLFESDTLLAGNFSILDVGLTLSKFIERCEGGVFPNPFKKIEIFDGGYNPSVELDSFHPAGGSSRISVLSIASPSTRKLRFDQKIKLELNAANTPFDSFDELVNLLSLGRDNHDQAIVEFVSYQSASLNRDRCSVIDGQVVATVNLATGLKPEKLTIGVRHSKPNKTGLGADVHRYSIAGSKLEWNEDNDVQLGQASIPIGGGDVVQLFVNYDSIHYDSYFLGDPSVTANPRTVALQTFDIDLSTIEDYLFKDIESKRFGREFEIGLSWLFWILGFGPSLADMHGVKGLQEAPDLIMVDDRTNFLVAEATVGTLQNNNKLNKLKERSTRLISALQNASSGHLEVLPVIISKLPYALIEPEVSIAKELGIAVIANEELQSLWQQRTQFASSNAVFDRLAASPETA